MTSKLALPILLVIILSLTACGGGQHYDTAIIGDSRVEGGSWDHLEICNHGRNGASVVDFLNDYEELDHAKKIYIQIGRNDIAYYGFTVDDTVNRINKLVSDIKAQGKEVVLFSTIPDYELHPETNRQISELNSRLNYDIDLIELSPDGHLIYHTDGVHLTQEGYGVWFKSFIDYGV